MPWSPMFLVKRKDRMRSRSDQFLATLMVSTFRLWCIMHVVNKEQLTSIILVLKKFVCIVQVYLCAICSVLAYGELNSERVEPC